MRGKASSCPVILHKAPPLQTSTGWTKVSLSFVSSIQFLIHQLLFLVAVQPVYLSASIIPAERPAGVICNTSLHCRAFPLKQMNAAPSTDVSGLLIFLLIFSFLVLPSVFFLSCCLSHLGLCILHKQGNNALPLSFLLHQPF